MVVKDIIKFKLTHTCIHKNVCIHTLKGSAGVFSAESGNTQHNRPGNCVCVSLCVACTGSGEVVISLLPRSGSVGRLGDAAARPAVIGCQAS